MDDPFFLLLLFGIPVISQVVSSQMRKRFVEHSADPMPLTGKQAAERMLAENGIIDVRVISTAGQLTDHYDPSKKTVNLSEVVYNQSNVAAVAVATHECGHAVQDATGYTMLTMRSKMVPLLRISNFAIPVLAFGGAGISQIAGNHGTAILCLVGLGAPTMFSLVTLPVEFNASRRALNWLEDAGIATGEKYSGARKALFWAAMTYVVAALGAIVQALYFAKIFLGRGRR
ncbi:zinc metallopeptidase [Rubripirellula amarantea]|uniref:Putative neutral zinc metallopeptidase n=1 Tax=Rubripirellula amarantea TaxID=2527999 RepID=A0A5C5WB55_9BACT|nr:zinc metallopeptidase [Rubripirellula amarantea]MDA8743487.1 zinc metallopeptidase [Rubripirellula amarantea]TWT48088.1 putative neutral zinc metallopeptidase [Rubripirellula amarantea]